MIKGHIEIKKDSEGIRVVKGLKSIHKILQSENILIYVLPVYFLQKSDNWTAVFKIMNRNI